MLRWPCLTLSSLSNLALPPPPASCLSSAPPGRLTPLLRWWLANYSQEKKMSHRPSSPFHLCLAKLLFLCVSFCIPLPIFISCYVLTLQLIVHLGDHWQTTCIDAVLPLISKSCKTSDIWIQILQAEFDLILQESVTINRLNIALHYQSLLK